MSVDVSFVDARRLLCVYIRIRVSTNGVCVYKRVSTFAFVCLQTGVCVYKRVSTFAFVCLQTGRVSTNVCLHLRSCVYKRGMCLQTCVYIRVRVSTKGVCVYKRASTFAFALCGYLGVLRGGAGVLQVRRRILFQALQIRV